MKVRKGLQDSRGLSYHYENPLCMNKLHEAVFSFLLEINADKSRDVVYVCIGTDRATGDCLGPLVGSRLTQLLPSAFVFGTLENPTHAANLVTIMENILSQHNNPLIIAVDACLGKVDRIGFINARRGSLRPGTALNKTLPAVGDFHLSAVVNVGGVMEHMVLQNTRLFTVNIMADIIARGLSLAHLRFEFGSMGSHRYQELS